MRKIALVICLACLSMPLVPSSSSEENHVVDIPCWKTGDWWEYSMHVKTSSADEDYVLKYTVSSVDDDYYTISISGNVSGRSSVMNWKGYVNGTQLVRRGDLAIYKERMEINGTARMFFIPGRYEYSIIKNYEPPLEEYDFPLFSKDVWGVNVKIHVKEELNVSIAGIFETNRSSAQDISMDGNSSFTGFEKIDVPAGSFECAKIQFTDGENSTSWWYSEDVKNVVYYSSRTSSSSTSRKLMAYHTSEYEIRVDFSLNPDVCAAGQIMTVRGRANYVAAETPVSGSQVRVFLPELGIFKNTNTDKNGYFSADITVPYAEDNTPTAYDIGSHGCIAFVEGAGSLSGENIRTLTITDVPPPDMNASGYSISPDVPVEGSDVKISIYAENSGGSQVENCEYRVEMDGDVIDEGSLGKLPPGARESIDIVVSPSAGIHAVKCILDPDNKIFERSEKNNVIEFNFTVELMDIVGRNLTVSPKGPINEGEVVTIGFTYKVVGTASIDSVLVVLRCGAVTVFSQNLSIHERILSGNTTWRALPGTIEINVVADPYEQIPESDKDNNIMKDEIFVNAVPKSEINASYLGGRKYLFSANDSYDPDGKIIAYLWDFGDNTTSTLRTVEHEYECAGDYTVKLTVIDDGGATSLCCSHVLISNSPPSLITPSVVEGFVGEKIHLTAYAVDPDGDIVNYSWDADGDGTWDFSSKTNSSFYFVYESHGYYRAMFKVTDRHNSTIVFPVDVIIREKEGERLPQNRTVKEKTENESLITLLIIAIMMLIVINAYYAYENIRVKKRYEVMEEPEPLPPPEEELEEHERKKPRKRRKVRKVKHA